MAMRGNFSECIVCGTTVSRRHQAVECDLCQRWQHRVCNTGITQEVYREAVRSGGGIAFECKECLCREKFTAANPTNDDDDCENFTEPPVLELSVPLSVEHRENPTNDDDDCENFTEPPVLELSVPLSVEHRDKPIYEEPPVLEISPNLESTRLADDTIPYGRECPDFMVDSCSGTDMSSPPEFGKTFTVSQTDGGNALNGSFNITDRDFEVASEMCNDSIPDRSLSETVLPHREVSYEIVVNGTKRGGKKLVASDGYSFTVKRTSKSTTYWTCSIRNKNLRCPAAVYQNGDSFTASNNHVHQPDPGVVKRTKMTAKIKTLAAQDVLRPAMEIVESTYSDEVNCHDFALSKPITLKRIANRHRENRRPKEPGPHEKFFEINMEYLGEGFIRREVVVDSHRHIICATDGQICLLRDSRRWFVDGTFKIIRRPFTQLWSIHTFIQKDGDIKQVPLAFVLMTRRQTDDYVQVLEAIKTMTLTTPSVQAVVMDFEQAAWIAFRQAFPGIRIQGCVFHWVQCVWRKVQHLGLQTTYMERQAVHAYIWKLMALPFLPHQHMRFAFENLQQMANSPPLVDLCSYLEDTWFSSTVFRLESVSVYKMGVRTNNDVEGWHRRINKKSNGCSLGFYTLVPILQQEAAFVQICLQLLNENQYRRDERRKYSRIQRQLDEIWDCYAEGSLSTVELLTKTSKLYGEFF